MGTPPTSDTPYQGKLQLIDNQVDAKSGTVRVRAAFDNKDGTLIPGQFARIRMGQAAPAARAGERARRRHRPGQEVRAGRGRRQQGRIPRSHAGRAGNGLRVVQTGLKAGERIVVNGLQRVRPGRWWCSRSW
jgi:multidrug efflux system membrane fusion protein